MNTLKSLKFPRSYCHFEIGHQVKTPKALKLMWFYENVDPCPFPCPQEMLTLAYTCDKKLLEDMNVTIGR